MKQRLLFLDAAKTIAIFSVLLSHSAQAWKFQEETYPLIEILRSYELILFMILAGYFSASAFSLSIFDFIKKQFSHLLLPALVWSLIGALYQAIRGNYEYLPYEFIGHAWFLKTLFAYYFLVYFSKKLRLPDYIIALSTILIAFSIGLSFLQFNWLLPYFWIGYFIRKYNTTIFSHSSKILTLSIMVLIISSYLKFKYSVPYYSTITMEYLKTDLFEYFIRFLFGLSCSLTIILGLKHLEKFIKASKFYTSIASIGKYTLQIYLLQIIMYWIVLSQPKFDVNSTEAIIISLLTAFITTLICILIAKFISRSPILNRILFGIISR